MLAFRGQDFIERFEVFTGSWERECDGSNWFENSFVGATRNASFSYKRRFGKDLFEAELDTYRPEIYFRASPEPTIARIIPAPDNSERLFGYLPLRLARIMALRVHVGPAARRTDGPLPLLSAARFLDFRNEHRWLWWLFRLGSRHRRHRAAATSQRRLR